MAVNRRSHDDYGEFGHAMEVETINRSFGMHVKSALMFVIGLTMWVGVPGVWLYVGSMIKAETNSIGLAIIAMGIGALATIIGLVRVLGRLNRHYQDEYLELNGHDPAQTPLEPVLVISAGIAAAAFGIWFIVFAGGGGPMLFSS